MTIHALASLPAPSGGAVRLTIYSDDPDTYALVLASDSATPPDPTYQDSCRRVFGGKLVQTHRAIQPVPKAPYQFMVLDLDSAALFDNEEVFYHVYEIRPDDKYDQPISIVAVPRCARTAAVTLARDIVKKRLIYHCRRALAEGIVQRYGIDEIQVLEQEQRTEGAPIPAVYIKERVNPNPSAETVGNQGEYHKDSRNAWREFIYQYNAAVDILVLTDNASERTDLERFLRGALDADREIWLAAGIENAEISSFTGHQIDAAGVDCYTAEISLTGGITTRITETRTQLQPELVTR